MNGVNFILCSYFSAFSLFDKRLFIHPPTSERVVCVSKQQTPIKAAVGISHVSPSNNSLHTFEKFPSELRRLVCDNPRGFSLTKAEKFNQLLRQPRGELVQNFSTGEGSVESSRKFSFRSL